MTTRKELHLFKVAVLFLVLGLACLCAIGCASSPTAKILNVAVVGAGVIDLVSTHQALARGGVEANPLMGHSTYQQVAVKALGIGAVLAGTAAMEKSRPVLAHVVRVVSIAAWSYASMHNWRMR